MVKDKNIQSKRDEKDFHVNILDVKRKCKKGGEGAYLQVFSNVL